MDAQLKFALVTEAQEHLRTHPRDAIHDITHHQRVWNFAAAIAKSIPKPVDLHLLEVLCWWHDVQLTDTAESHGQMTERTAAYLAGLLPEGERVEIRDSIVNHEFGFKPNFLTGKLLQDADKLDQTSLERLQTGVKAVHNEQMPRAAALASLNALRAGADKILASYHFEWSRKYHREHMPEMIAQLDIVIPLIEKSQEQSYLSL